MDIYQLSCLTALSVGGFSYYKGYFNIIYDSFIFGKRNYKLILSIVQKLHEDVKIDESSNMGFSVNDSDMSASVIYKRFSQAYLLLIPYKRKYIVSMSQYKAELLIHNKEHVDITQQPGIPYMVSSHDLGGYCIKITNEETGFSFDYKGKHIPMYAVEVMDIE